jgi:hypothetical protein
LHLRSTMPAARASSRSLSAGSLAAMIMSTNLKRSSSMRSALNAQCAQRRRLAGHPALSAADLRTTACIAPVRRGRVQARGSRSSASGRSAEGGLGSCQKHRSIQGGRLHRPPATAQPASCSPPVPPPPWTTMPKPIRNAEDLARSGYQMSDFPATDSTVAFATCKAVPDVIDGAPPAPAAAPPAACLQQLPPRAPPQRWTTPPNSRCTTARW